MRFFNNRISQVAPVAENDTESEVPDVANVQRTISIFTVQNETSEIQPSSTNGKSDVDSTMQEASNISKSKTSNTSEELAFPSSEDGRDTWESKTDFFMSYLGYGVGLGNVWRFSYISYKNGGGAFLIPYAIMLFLVGLPMFFMKLCLGQFSSSGPSCVWKIFPMFRGIGYGMVLVSAFIGLYYNVIITYTLYYLFGAFNSNLPWAGCNNDWNTAMCHRLYDDCLSTGNSIMTDNNTCVSVLSLSAGELEHYGISAPHGQFDLSNYVDPLKAQRRLPSEEYFKNSVIRESSGIGEVGSIVWPLFSCLVIIWSITFVCVQQGIKSSGKVGNFTAAFPYVVLILFLILGLTLEGSVNGIYFFIIPQWELLYEPRIWLDATVQIFFSLGTSWSRLLTRSPYKRFHNNCYFDAIFVAIANFLTSVFAGIVIFSILGFMANELGREVNEVVDQGFGLAFIAYPEALAKLPAASVWSVLFFFMLLTLGLDTQFTIMETVVTFITDVFPEMKRNKTKVLLASCLFMFLASIICVTEAGVYWVNLLDSYSASFVILTFATMECIIVCWVYGYDRFKEDIGIMIGAGRVHNKLFNYWHVCWCYVTPALLIFIQVYSFIYRDAPSYNGMFPKWAHTTGWLLTGSTFIFIPTFIILALVKSSGTFLQRLRLAYQPSAEWLVCRLKA